MTTRFDRFCRRHRIRAGALAKLSGYTTRHINLVRRGTSYPTLEFVAAMVRAARRHTGDASITANQMFELDDEDGA